MKTLELRAFEKSQISIQVQLERRGDFLHLNYQLSSPSFSEILIPSLNSSNRFLDGLWEHTCFECFLASPQNESYVEYNFSPSGDYAMYAFSSYRERKPPTLFSLSAPQILSIKHKNKLEMQIKIPNHAGKMGLTAVIEKKKGNKEYFALTHHKERPDFHDPASFQML